MEQEKVIEKEIEILKNTDTTEIQRMMKEDEIVTGIEKEMMTEIETETETEMVSEI